MKKECPICHDSVKIILLNKSLNLYKCDPCLHTFSVIPKEKQESYNDDYFQKTHKNWMTNPNYPLFDFIYNESIKLSGNKQIRSLDVGCGNGDFLKYISAKDPALKLSGIDLIDNKHPNIHFIKGDFLKEKIEGKFNNIVTLATVEHVDDPHLFIQKINSLLEPDGVLFITTINDGCLLHQIARVLNKIGLHASFKRIYSSHHLQHYTNQSLKKLMEMNGFSVIIKKNHNYPLKAVDLPESNFFIGKTYKLLVGIFFQLPKSFGDGILQTIVCKKANIGVKNTAQNNK
jgi:2-polyprenyl-3-methyl-5-hydroxy-6-metoxy-1,4-benzoquinol methylase